MSGPEEVPELVGEEAARFLEAQGLGDLGALFMEDRPPKPDAHAEWCDACGRWHQPTEQPRPCSGPGCQRTTHAYHGLCEACR